MKPNLRRFRDMDYACILKFTGLRMITVDWIGKTAYFVFDDPENEADQIIDRYQDNKIEGNVYEFVQVQKNLKKRVMSAN